MQDPLPIPDLQLENWRDLRAQLVWAYDGPVATNNRKMEYTGVPIPAWFLRSGSAHLEFADRTEQVPKEMWFFPSAETGVQFFSKDAHLLSVRFLVEWPTRTCLFERNQSYQISPDQVPMLTRIGERIARFISKRFSGTRNMLPTLMGSPNDYFEIQRLFYGWLLAYSTAMKKLGLLVQTTGTLDERVRQAVHLLEIRKLNEPAKEAELAQEVGLSRSQLNRLFVANLGQTPSDYWEKKRMLAARLAIVESNQSIKSIAYDLGFNSLPHFSSWVRKKFQKSPRDLRTSDFRSQSSIPYSKLGKPHNELPDESVT